MNNPKVILSAITLALAIPIAGITLALINTGGAGSISAANPTSNSPLTPQTGASAPIATQQAANEVGANDEGASDAVTPEPPTPLPDPLTPNTSPSPPAAPATPSAMGNSTPAAEPQQDKNVKKSVPPKTSPTSTPARTQQKIQTRVQGDWVAPVITAPGEVTITAPTLISGVKLSTTIACSPSANCTLEGSTLKLAADTQVSITYSAKGTKKFTAWSRTVAN